MEKTTATSLRCAPPDDKCIRTTLGNNIRPLLSVGVFFVRPASPTGATKQVQLTRQRRPLSTHPRRERGSGPSLRWYHGTSDRAQLGCVLGFTDIGRPLPFSREISLRLAEKLLEVHRPTIPQHEIVNGVRSGVHTTDLNKKSLHHREKLINSAPRLEPMSAGTDEYEQVRELFSRSCKNFTVLHIERFVLFRVYRTKILCFLTSSPVWTQCCRSPPSAQI